MQPSKGWRSERHHQQCTRANKVCESTRYASQQVNEVRPPVADSRYACIVVGYNRANYFTRTIRSLLNNQFMRYCDLWVFLDKDKASEQEKQVAILQQELESASFHPRQCEVVLRTVTLGCGRNLIDARRHIFDRLGYDYAFMFEDDMVVSHDYMQLCVNLWHWSQDNYSDIGVVQAYSPCWLSASDKLLKKDHVAAANVHWWGYFLSKTVWNSIRDLLCEYDRRFLKGRRYRDRDIPAISQWAQRLLAQCSTASTADSNLSDLREHPSVSDAGSEAGTEPDTKGLRKSFPGAWDAKNYFEQNVSCGQDAITALALHVAGLKKIVTVVNRGLPIGRRGIHSTDASFEHHRLDKVLLHDIPGDSLLNEFRPVQHESVVQHKWMPYMRVDEVAAIERLCIAIKPRCVLEFGAGGSTLYFSKHESIQLWLSLESKMDWLEAVLANLEPDSPVRLIRCDKEELLERVEQILTQERVDLFFVDGYDRPKLLHRLRKHLESHAGIVLLHDYARQEYRDAIAEYPFRRELTPPSRDAQGLMLLSVSEATIIHATSHL